MDRYEQYKDSGDNWLGKIPSHWELSKLKFCAIISPKNGEIDIAPETLVSFTPMENIKDGFYIPCNKKYVNFKNNSQYTEYQEGDIAFAKVTPCFENNNIAIMNGLANGIGYGSSELFILRATTVDTKFLFYLLQTASFKAQGCASMTGAAGLKRVSSDMVKNYQFGKPSIEEQKAIAAYLDTEVSKIDEAIKQQQKMIELLNERRQIIISEAVTKGLNPDVKMKDSGIDWMAAIPSHWEIISLKRACTIKTGKTPSSNSTKYWDGGKVNWFTPGDFKDFKLTDSERKVTRTAIRENACFEYPACSVYLIGIGGTIGKIAYSEHSASCNQQINVLIPKRNVHYKYIAYVMTICRPEVMRNANMSTLPIINQEKTGGIMITLPPFLEQKAISQQIEVKCASIQEKINQANTEIALLTERKRIIINDVVTGKIKVL